MPVLATPAASGPSHVRGVVLISIAVAIFAAMDTLAKYLGQFYPVPGLVWARFAVHLAVMLALLAPRHGLSLARTARPGLQILRSALLLGSTLFFFQALRFMPLAEASAIGFVAPFLVTALSVPLLGETVGIRRWAAVATGFCGVLIIVRPGSGALGAAALLPLGMALCFSLYQIITRKLSATENPVTTLFYTALVGTGGMSLVLPFAWETPTAWHGMLLLLLGLLGGFSHFLLIKAFAVAPASLLAPYVYTQLVWAGLFGLLVFGDFPDPWSLAGMGLIAASGLYTGYRERLRRANG